MEKNNYFFGLTKYWWIPLITGLIFIGFGVWCLCDPSQSLPLLAYIFAGLIGLIGVGNLVYGCSSLSSYHGSGWALAAGVIEVLFSILLFFIPTPVLTWVFTWGIGIYIIFMSIYAFCESLMMARYNSFWVYFMLLLLVAAFVFACIFILGPVGGALLGWLYIGLSFICYGCFRVVLAFKVRRINKDFEN